MPDGFRKLTAETLGNGEAISQLNEELDRAVENILDINKDPSVTRKVTLVVKITPVKGKERQEYMIEYQADSKLPSDAAGVQPLFLNRETGYVPNMEQMSFEESFDEETGEVTRINASNGGAEGTK
ncbi:MAG: hypothetical protein GY841_15620 [FCB group bacterium]|nr:hypothetical protein [FCB group bacterium]